jgi:putative transposase
MDQPDSEPQVSSEPPSEEYWLLDELSEQARRKMDWVNKIREAQSASDETLERQLIQAAAKDLGCCPKTVTRMVNAVKEDGLIALVRESRSDKGKARYISEPWRELVIALYKRGRKSGRRTNRNQIWGLIEGIINRIEVARNSPSNSLQDLFDGIAISLGSADESHTSTLNKILKEIKQEVSDGELKPPRSHVSVYKIIRTHLEAKKKKPRHPGQGPLKIIKTTDGDIEINESNKVLQIDHTRLDVLVVDQEGNEIGTPFLSVAVDSYSSGIAGFYLGFRQPSSLEVALVLRHAILPKHYGPEYELRETWNICGLPKYLVTDRAKEFKSQHLQQIAAHLGFNLRYRFMPEQGGIVESVFDKLNKEFNSRLPGYKGSNVQQRPKDAEKYACITIEELERKLVRHFVDHVNWHDAPGVAEKRAGRWEKMMLEPPRIPDERELDICLLKQNKRPKVRHHSI